MNFKTAKQKGFSLIEIIFVAALSTLIFGALLGSFTYTIKLMNLSRAQLSAQSVANDRLEYFRSLPYDNVGTISGIPSGIIPQNSTTTLNGIVFSERILVEYVDDPADGLAAADTNGIPSDYKRVKVEYTWTMGGATSTMFFISNIVPRSIETTAGGGTIRVNVIDDNSNLLPGATVRLVNSSSTSIDITKTTDINGAVLFSGAPADSNYEVFVTANILGNQYSAAQTYKSTTSNPNPLVAPFAVLESDISTITFQIGELSDLDILTKSTINEGSFLENFDDLLSVATTTNVTVAADDLVLENVAGVFEPSGIAYLGPISPLPLLEWAKVRTAVSLPFNTSFLVQFFTGTTTGPYTLISDLELPGNSGGFSDVIIDISSIDAGAYPDIFVGVSLATADSVSSPLIDEMEVFYRQAEVIMSNVAFDIRGSKMIGTDLLSAPIYKYLISTTTDGLGVRELFDVEFDNYTVTPPGAYDIATACSEHPFVHKAGVDGQLELVLVANAPHTLRVSVVDGLGQAIPGASVNVTRSGYDVTQITNICGQVFFTGGVSADSDYVVDVSLSGYSSVSVDPFEIDSDTFVSITMF